MLRLEIEIDKQWLPANLEKDTSISMEETSQVWSLNAGRSSIPFTLSVYENQHILGNVSDMRGSSVFKRLYGARFRLYVGGILFRTGVVHLDSSVPVTDTIEVELVGNGKEWSELISDLDCRKIPLLGDVLLGVGLVGEAKFVLEADVSYVEISQRKWRWRQIDTVPAELPFALPRIMKPEIGGVSRVNLSEPYSQDNPYCNIMVCWTKRDDEGNQLNEYDVYEADRINTSPCFYVLYFLDCLFKHLSVSCTRNDMKLYDEMKRLAFVNMGCFYETRGEVVSTGSEIQASLEIEAVETSGSLIYNGYSSDEKYLKDDYKNLTPRFINSSDLKGYRAYATPDNFPNKSVSNVLDAIQNLFGVRFLFDSERQKMEIVFIRDILTQQDVIEIPCHIIERHPIYEHTEGFRLRYSADKEEDDVDEKDYLRDTSYNTPHLKTVVDSMVVGDIPIYQFDKNYYIDPVTGNGYAIKIDSEREKNGEKNLHAALIEVAQFVRAEYGNCTNKEFVDEISIDATPVVMSRAKYKGDYYDAYFADVQMNPKSSESKTGKMTVQQSCQVSRHRASEQFAYAPDQFINVKLSHKIDPSYDPSTNDESPLDTYDCGLTLGFMRGPGSKSKSEIINANFDGEGNSQWVTVADKPAFNSDSIDIFGNHYDYNGTGEVVGESGTVYIDSKDKAHKLLSIFTNSHADLASPARASLGGDRYRMTSKTFGYNNPKQVLFTRVLNDGTILTQDELDDYIEGIFDGHLTGNTKIGDLWERDSKGYNILIGYYNSTYLANGYASIIEQTGAIYFGSGSGVVTIPEGCSLGSFGSDSGQQGNGIGGDPQRISLKLKAEKKVDGQYLPVTGVGAARRGIFDNFYAEYAYWVTHRKLAHIEAEVELADLINLDMTKKYRIGDYVGFIKSCKYDIDNNGIGIVTFELYYL